MCPRPSPKKGKKIPFGRREICQAKKTFKKKREKKGDLIIPKKKIEK